MKKICLIALLISTLLFTFEPFVQAQTDNPKQTLNQYISDLQKNPNDYALREKIIRHVQTMRPVPAIPEEARRHYVMARTLFEDAKNAQDYRSAIDEFNSALLIAPWWQEAYLKLSIALKAAGRYDEAIGATRLFIVTNPGEEIARKAQDEIYILEAKRKKAQSDKAAGESNPVAIAAKKQNEYEGWLKKLDGRRYTSTGNCLAGGVTGTIDVKGKFLVFGGYVDGKYRGGSHEEIRGRETSYHWTRTLGRYSEDVSETVIISEDGDRITNLRRYSNGVVCTNIYLWQR